ncbi:hypothetical protein GZ998_03185 [Actinomyces sp. 594]|uniref:tetratricopeptide repeat protein n=1 Tax=Actinomyces sp. 594 TaxID=2057793 RepID=UPI001C5946B7|nr:hypothetical protein [Actinomyces sp. 594]MBW3068517.1 hypothetical protein [Actinomyces sp. 594]
MPPPAPGDQTGVVDYFKELGIERSASIDEIQDKLHRTRAQWEKRASLAGKRGDAIRQQLSMIDAASQVFADEDSMLRYRRQLSSAPSSEDETKVDWVARAWNYYFSEDYGPASVSARKARQHDGDDPTAYVVSAWIEMADGDSRRAEEYASEAYVLDEQGDDTVEVHEVRGATFIANEKYDKALASLERALKRAPDPFKPEIYARMSLAQIALKNFKAGWETCLAGLSLREQVLPVIHERLVGYACKAVILTYTDEDNEVATRALGAMKTQIAASRADSGAKMTITKCIDECLEVISLDNETKKKPEEPWGFPVKLCGAAVVALIVLFAAPSAATILVAFVILGVLGVWFYMISQQKQAIEEYESKVRRYNELYEKIRQEAGRTIK